MTVPTAPEGQGSSTRPYLIRALHDWCTDNGFTPYIAVFVDGKVQVPQEYVKNNEIVLNVGFEATSGLKLGNEQIEFKARFGGSAREIVVPIDHVVAIYARENGQGMAFPVPSASGGVSSGAPTVLSAGEGAVRTGPRLAVVDSPVPVAPAAAPAEPPEPPEPPSPAGGARPSLKRIK
ncbi:MAG: ClpXP protease specificity-enhancing factor [Burkholderiaceae bacterium]|nr:ClpXP protease specificity-enhancing factor [Burkholderiaceae bacterium]